MKKSDKVTREGQEGQDKKDKGRKGRKEEKGQVQFLNATDAPDKKKGDRLPSISLPSATLGTGRPVSAGRHKGQAVTIPGAMGRCDIIMVLSRRK